MSKKWIGIFLVAAVAAAFVVNGLAKDTPVESTWASGPVRIDGQNLEWQDVSVQTDSGSKAQYALMNDAGNLYILFVFADPMSASTIGYTGMTIFFDAGDRKSKDLGVHFYRKELSAEALIAALVEKGETLTDERKAEIRKQKAYNMYEAEVINKKNAPAPSDPAVKNQPPMFEPAGGQKVLIYEFRIPLSRINQSGGIGAEPGKTIKLGFEWGGMTREAMKGMMAGQTAQSGMSSQGPGVSGDVGTTRDDTRGLQRETDYRRDPRTRFHSFWIDVKLAAPGS